MLLRPCSLAFHSVLVWKCLFGSEMTERVYPYWGEVCRQWSHDQAQPGSFLQRGTERTLGTRLPECISHVQSLEYIFSSYRLIRRIYDDTQPKTVPDFPLRVTVLIHSATECHGITTQIWVVITSSLRYFCSCDSDFQWNNVCSLRLSTIKLISEVKKDENANMT